ncbi:hypothetical protein EDB85DRAFT_2142927 [Lactarius pseudohatsudake]|nr:hypothetical protein EDB85DRAFT_2142927 [Lactarius pseudohatsudake]
MSTAQSTGAHLTGAHLKKPQKKKAPRRKRKIRDIDLTEEVRDLEREIALSSTSEASKSPPCTKDGQTLSNLGETMPFHTCYSDIHPPDPKQPHPLWQQATATEILPGGRRQPKHTRRSTSTLMQVATDHAFTGTYVQRFRKADPPENISCPCGAAVRDAYHITQECPRYRHARVDVGIYSTRPHHTQSLIPLQSLLGTRKGAEMLLRFFDQTRALSKPETGPPLPVPPEPD